MFKLTHTVAQLVDLAPQIGFAGAAIVDHDVIVIVVLHLSSPVRVHPNVSNQTILYRATRSWANVRQGQSVLLSLSFSV
jgi:hypothetical protein